MALLMKKLYQGYFWVFDELSDKRTDDIFILSSPIYLLAIQLTYVYAVKVLGPKLMENREPFNIRKVIMVYNCVQIIWNAHLFYEASKIAFADPFECGPINFGTDPTNMYTISLSYQLLYLKLLDLMDTVFFVLRKSYRQVSFLHVYHHCAMVLCVWGGNRFFAGGVVGFWFALVNCFVHVLMFTYYLLTTIDSSWKNSIRIKKALTQIQLIQFAFFIVLFGRTLIDSNCGYPALPCFLLIPQNCFMLFLFGDFYLKAYVFNKKNAENQQ